MAKSKRIYIRRYPRNRDFWEVVGGGENIQLMSKTEINRIAEARRRVRARLKRDG